MQDLCDVTTRADNIYVIYLNRFYELPIVLNMLNIENGFFIFLFTGVDPEFPVRGTQSFILAEHSEAK